MKQLTFFLVFILMIAFTAQSQDYSNFISCKVNGVDYKAEARRLKIPTRGIDYLAIASFQVSPDVQVWIRFYYLTDSLKPGVYPIISENGLESEAKKKADRSKVWVLVDYTEETKGLGHAFHDGESLSGTVAIDKATATSVEGSFEAELTGVYYKKRAVATMTGSGIKGNLEKKLITKAGGGMLANAGPHEHENTKKSNETDSIILSEGRFFVDWSKPEKE
ncbi:MAG: hypothetical protein K0B15_09525 [Lentimicrobium sp.]|nr:hypothetical protein [Lentimicrobium sp.]